MAKRKTTGDTVQAKDCYDPADYIMVHKDHYDVLKAHEGHWLDACEALESVQKERDAFQAENAKLRSMLRGQTFVTES